ncbi:MAG: molybdopterin molybdotransferase MoeA [Desulfobulbaceae bacterium]
MKGFFQLISTGEFLDLIRRFTPLPSEDIPLADALGRVTAEDVPAPEHLPPFARSTMDGFAVRARDTFGCGETEPALFEIAGEISMGDPGESCPVGPGKACVIWTGGELPPGADAVVMLEYTTRIDDRTIEVFRPVAPGENVIRRGEDFRKNEAVLPRGHRLRPQDLGVLAGLGITKVSVHRRPRVAIVSTGDELLPVDRPLAPGKIRDINSTTLAALVAECGGIPLARGIVSDHPETMRRACREALEMPADVILFSGGSSVGRRDYTLQILTGLEDSELLAHGVSIRPGKPTILVRRGNTALFGLPGHVGSAIVVFHILVRPLIRRFLGLDDSGLQRTRALAGEPVPSAIGREDYVRVALARCAEPPGLRAAPIHGKSGLISPLVRADGLLVIDRDTEGVDRGEEAEVILLP